MMFSAMRESLSHAKHFMIKYLSLSLRLGLQSSIGILFIPIATVAMFMVGIAMVCHLDRFVTSFFKFAQFLITKLGFSREFSEMNITTLTFQQRVRFLHPSSWFRLGFALVADIFFGPIERAITRFERKFGNINDFQYAARMLRTSDFVYERLRIEFFAADRRSLWIYWLEYKHIYDLFINRHVTAMDLNTMPSQGLRFLDHKEGAALLADGFITVAQISRIVDDEGLRALLQPDEITRLRNAGIENARNRIDALLPNNNIGNVPNRNNAVVNRQNTHTASVHDSVSKSASKLWQRYNAKINSNDSLRLAIENFKQVILQHTTPVMQTYNARERNCLPEAQACIRRLTRPEYTFTDSASKVTTPQLLGMAYLAIHDPDIATHNTTLDRITLFIHGLYETERGYNIEEVEYDNDTIKSSKLCTAGTFNKITEKFAAWHPDVEIIYVNAEIISFKAHIIFIEHIVKYFAPNIRANNIDTIITQLQNDEAFWDDIWQNINTNVQAELERHFEDQLQTVLRVSDRATGKTIIAEWIAAYKDNSALSITYKSNDPSTTVLTTIRSQLEQLVVKGKPITPGLDHSVAANSNANVAEPDMPHPAAANHAHHKKAPH